MLFLGTVKWTESLVVDGSVDSNMLYLGKDRYYWAFECVSSGIKMKQGGVLSVISDFMISLFKDWGILFGTLAWSEIELSKTYLKSVGLLDIAMYVSLLVYFEKFVTSSCIHRTRYST